jgi:hypothetical protein
MRQTSELGFGVMEGQITQIRRNPQGCGDRTGAPVARAQESPK